MPGPYAFVTDRATGDPGPASDHNGIAAALNEAASIPTPSVLALRDAAGRMQAEDPDAAEDVATKGWVETQNGLLVPKSLVNAKGDLLVATANDTVGRLGAGANGTVLKSNSAAAEGLEWGDVAGGLEMMGLESGLIVHRLATDSNGANGTHTLSNAEMDVITFPIYADCRLRSAVIRISTAGDAASTVKLWLYGQGTHGSAPDTLLSDMSVPGDVTGSIASTPGTPISLPQGWYSFIMGTNAVTTLPVVTGGSSAGPYAFAGRTGGLGNVSVALTRAATVASGLGSPASPPATIDWNNSSLRVSEGSSGKRVPLIHLDLIPAA